MLLSTRPLFSPFMYKIPHIFFLQMPNFPEVSNQPDELLTVFWSLPKETVLSCQSLCCGLILQELQWKFKENQTNFASISLAYQTQENTTGKRQLLKHNHWVRLDILFFLCYLCVVSNYLKPLSKIVVRSQS